MTLQGFCSESITLLHTKDNSIKMKACSQSQSSSLPCASSVWLANHKGIDCFKGEPQAELEGEVCSACTVLLQVEMCVIYVSHLI